MKNMTKMISGIGRSLTLLLACLLAISSHVASGARSKRGDDQKYVATTIKEMPYLKEEGANFVGFIPDLMDEITKITKIEFELKIVDDNLYGQQADSGSWSGMVGDIVNGDAQLAAAPMTISDKRKTAVDFTTPFMTFDTVLLVKKPATVGQVRDLAKQATIQYGVIREGHTANFFKQSDDEDFRKMWQEMEQKNNQMATIKDGVERVRRDNGTFAFIMESKSATYWTKKAPCDLEAVGTEELNKGSYALATKKSSDLTKKLTDAIKQLKENGKVEEIENKWWNGSCNGGSATLAGHHLLMFSIAALLGFWQWR